MFRKLACVPVLLVTLALAACGESEPGQLEVEGSIDQALLARGPHSKVVVLWSVSSGSPDYMYKFGEGAILGTTFKVTLPGPPPAEAINSYGLAVGVVGLLRDDVVDELPDGKVDRKTFDLGVTAITRGAVIWRQDSAAVIDWANTFPDREYSCGACVPSDMTTFDSFEPASCNSSTMNIVAADDPCDWT